MSTTFVWLRRGLGAPLALFLTVFLAWFLWSNLAWSLDAQWGTRYIGALTTLLAPLVAATVAYDQAKRYHPALADLSRSTRRGGRSALLPALSVYAWVVTALAIVIAGVVITVRAHHGLTGLDPWLAPELLAATGAIVAVGMAAGSLVHGHAAPVLAATIALVAPLMLSVVSTDLGGTLFAIAHSEGTLLGLARVPHAAVTAILTHCTVIVACGVVTWLGTRPVPFDRRIAVASLLPVVAALTAQTLTFPSTGTFEPTHEALACVGSRPEVCAPERAQEFMRPVQRDFAAAVTALDGSGLTLPARLTYARMGTNGWTKDSTNLSFNLEDIHNGHLPAQVLTESLATPRACRALFDESTGQTASYLEREGRVRAFMLDRIQHPSRTPAPPGIRADYQALLDCPTITLPS